VRSSKHALRDPYRLLERRHGLAEIVERGGGVLVECFRVNLLMRRVGAPEEDVFVAQGNLANSYQFLGRLEEALSLRRDVYSGCLKLNGEEHEETLRAANNYAYALVTLKRFEEGKALMRKMIPVAQRVLGDAHNLTLRMRWCYAQSLYENPGATLDAIREAVTRLEDLERTARRVFGGAHPTTVDIGECLQESRAALRARVTPASSA